VRRLCRLIGKKADMGLVYDPPGSAQAEEVKPKKFAQTGADEVTAR
jgi:hypothetical protein